MRVLWISMNSSLFDTALSKDGYNGGGWILSLQKALCQNVSELELGVTFLYPKKTNYQFIDNVSYFPIIEINKSFLKKIRYYWGDYKNDKQDAYNEDILQIITDFKPDLIHLWGTENLLASVCLISKVPVIVHLQGILGPYSQTYFSYKMNKFSFLLNSFTKSEWILRNGYICAEKVMICRAELERSYFKSLKYIMGRTHWDFNISRLLSPDSEYFHVDEILRDSFYVADAWNKPQGSKMIIFSTISQTAYKGLDLILRTAKLLKTLSGFEIEWRVAGVSIQFAKIYERQYKILGNEFEVKYLGSQNADQIVIELQKCDLYIHPSYIDNSPNSLCEAQLLGVPVIATNVGGVSSLIENKKTGLLIPANSPYEITDLIIKAWKEPEYMKTIGINGRLVALKRHDKKKVVTELIDVYSSVISKNKK